MKSSDEMPNAVSATRRNGAKASLELAEKAADGTSTGTGDEIDFAPPAAAKAAAAPRMAASAVAAAAAAAAAAVARSAVAIARASGGDERGGRRARDEEGAAVAGVCGGIHSEREPAGWGGIEKSNIGIVLRRVRMKVPSPSLDAYLRGQGAAAM